METVDLIGLLAPVTYFVFLITERIWSARTFPPRRGWQWIGVGFLILIGTVSTVVPLLIPGDWLAAHRWLDGTGLGIVGGTIVGFVALEGLMYAYHRTAHTFDFLWRAFHQMHHSPSRVDVPGSVVFHPLEMVVQVAEQLFVTVIVLGIDPIAAALVGYLVAFNGYFRHWNVRTPQWIGYILQRPEAHCVHHRLGFHYYNFADLSLWDIVFGTFRNPPEFRGECGFEAGADRRRGAMPASRMSMRRFTARIIAASGRVRRSRLREATAVRSRTPAGARLYPRSLRPRPDHCGGEGPECSGRV